MTDILIVARRELQDVLGRKILVIFLIVMGAFLGVYTPLDFLQYRYQFLGGMQAALDIYTGSLFLGTSLALGWGMTTSSFLPEKFERTIETLLTTPLSPRAIWLGKTVALFVLSYPVTLTCGLVFIILLNHIATPGSFIGPSVLGWVNILIVAPVFSFTTIALTGLSEMVLTYPQIGQFVAFGVFYAVYRLGLTRPTDTWLIGVYAAVAAGLSIVTAFAARFLDRERIVLSIK